MYFQVTLKRNMLLHPRNFGPKMREVLRANLKKEVEGTCNGKYGYIVLVTKIHEGEGFQVRYPTVGERERARGAALRQLVASLRRSDRGRWRRRRRTERQRSRSSVGDGCVFTHTHTPEWRVRWARTRSVPSAPLGQAPEPLVLTHDGMGDECRAS
jgi:hypothetical protein